MKLLCGDCLDLLPTLADRSVDLVLTDPPYGTTACSWDAVIPFEPMWREVRRVLKPRGAAVFTASQPFTSALVMSNPKEFRHSWVWQKNRAANVLTARFAPMKRHEDVLVFGKSGVAYRPQMRKGKPYRAFKSDTATSGEVNGNAPSVHKDNPDGLLQPITVIDIALDRTRLHPTQKPVALMEYLIRTYTNDSETVLDFTMGSGTTGVACANTGRKFIGIERDPAYFAVAEKRIAEAVGVFG
jgi:site-specific DNA-methyltransferase (adenine-specific)